MGEEKEVSNLPGSRPEGFGQSVMLHLGTAQHRHLSWEKSCSRGNPLFSDDWQAKPLNVCNKHDLMIFCNM